MPSHHFRFVSAFAALFALTGCAGLCHREKPAAPKDVPAAVEPVAQPSAVDPALLQPPSEPFTLGPGDKVGIEIMGDATTRSEATVGPDGKLYFHILSGLDVWGLTLGQTRDLIADKMEGFLRQKPTVAVTLHHVESKRIWVLGRLNTPGVYPLTGPTTLLEAISEAGGPSSASALASLTGALGISGIGSTSEAADLRHSFVIRQGRVLSVDFDRLLRHGDLSQNIYLQPDDFVYLPSAGTQVVYVLGAVSRPQSVSFSGEPTLVQTIASAGGVIKDAYVSHVAIVRGSLSEPKMAVIDYQAIVHGKAPDVRLEPHDIVFVPYTPYRTAERYLNIILDTFARTMGVNEGAHAIAPNTGAIGVNLAIP